MGGDRLRNRGQRSWEPSGYQPPPQVAMLTRWPRKQRDVRR
jgi:hypothetical protein